MPAVDRSAIVGQVTTYEENLIKRLTEAVVAGTTASNGLRYAVTGLGQQNHMAVTRCDLGAAEARITALIMGQQASVDLSPLADVVTRAEKISSTLKALAGQVTQLDSSTEQQTAP